MESDSGPKMKVNLLRHASSKRVLYMEAGKDFIDLLLSFLVLPVGTILTRLGSFQGFSSSLSLPALANVATSVENLDARALYVKKSDLLTPVASKHIKEALLLRLEAGVARDEEKPAVSFYRCRNLVRQNYMSKYCDTWVQSDTSTQCPTCNAQMTEQVWMTEVQNPASQVASQRKPGFVRKSSTFIVTDALEISPVSTITSINLLIC